MSRAASIFLNILAFFVANGSGSESVFCQEYGVSMQAEGITQQCRRIIIFGVHDKN